MKPSPFLLLTLTAVSFAQQPAPPLVAPPAPSARPSPTPPPPRHPDDAITPAIKDPKRHDEFLYRIKEGEIGLLFVGDSITDFWPRRGEWSWLKFASYHPANFGISGDRTEHVLWRVTHGELDGINPKLVVLMIGTNNVGQNPTEQPEWAAAGVKKIVETIREKIPSSKILLLAIFPRGEKDSAARKVVGEINQLIAKLDDGKAIYFFDINQNFLDVDGNLPADVMPDKLHPSGKGYDIWYNAISAKVEELMK